MKWLKWSLLGLVACITTVVLILFVPHNSDTVFAFYTGSLFGFAVCVVFAAFDVIERPK